MGFEGVWGGCLVLAHNVIILLGFLQFHMLSINACATGPQTLSPGPLVKKHLLSFCTNSLSAWVLISGLGL